MRSPMIQNADYIDHEDKRNYSDLQVMKSAAGYYIGTVYNGPDGPEPGSRDTGYYQKREMAEVALRYLEADDPRAPFLRMRP
jgi:hypothetical protein